eukprot:s5747_g7.t2
MESSHQLPLITEIAIDVGILKNKATEQCSCGQTAWKLEQRQRYCNWRCRNCRKTVSVCAGDTDLFSIKVALCSLITRQSRPCGIDHRSPRTLFDSFRSQDVDWLCLGSGRETRPFNTAGSSLQTAANMEQHLHERVRCFHFADWLSGSDLFQVFGALRSAELSGGASWATLAPFLADRASAKKDEGIIETIESGSDE